MGPDVDLGVANRQGNVLHAKLPRNCQILVFHNVRSWWLVEPFPHPRQANGNSLDETVVLLASACQFSCRFDMKVKCYVQKSQRGSSELFRHHFKIQVLVPRYLQISHLPSFMPCLSSSLMLHE